MADATDLTRAHRLWAHARRMVTTYLWNRRARMAILVASPAILTTIGSIAINAAIDKRLNRLTKERDTITLEIERLDRFTKDFEAKELLRASFLVGLAGIGAEDRLKYTLDRLYRASASGSLRRIAASVYPADWAGKLAGYDALVASDYHEPTTVKTLQDIENTVVQDALKRQTSQQAVANRLADKIERLEARKSVLQTTLNAALYILTILVFFLQTAA